MAEEKQEKKRAGIVRRILKWIGLAVLSILLILAIVFQAPWKVITLLFIVLAACTILPKHLRKWFWLSAATIVLVLIIWIFLPDDAEGWRPYTFNEELAAIEAKYTIPPEENAALIYDELLKTITYRDPNEPEFFIKSSPSSRDGPWLSKDHPETAKWLKSYQSKIEKLLQAAKKERCRFPIGADPVSYFQYTERLPKMRRCALLLVSAANNDIAEGRTDTALEKYLCIIQMANHMCQQPPMMYHLVGLALEYLAFTYINRLVIESQTNGNQLELIGDSIKNVENTWSADWRKMLDFEKLFAKNSLCSLFYEVNPKGRTRLSGGQFTIDRQFPQKIPPKPYRQRKLTKVRAMLGWFYFPSTPEKVSEFIDASFEKYYAMAEPDFDWDKEPSESQPRWKVNYRSLIDILTTLPGSAYYRIHEIYLRYLAYRRGSRLLVAIKQYNIEHNCWPANLDTIKSTVPVEALIDPVTGNQFVYENHGERFSLYGEAANIWPK